MSRARPIMFWAACAAMAAAYIWLTSALRIHALFEATYDDGLFLRSASWLLREQWLGPYDNLTLVKGAAYPVFLAAASALGVPVMTAQAALYAAACLVMIAAACPAVPSRLALLLIFGALLFNPEVWAIWRIIRDYFYTGLSVAVLGFAAGAFARRGKPVRRLAPWLAGAGLALGVLAVTREETVWIAPPLAVLAAAFLAEPLRPRAWRALVRRVVLVGATAIIALSVVGVNAALNFVHYRTWATIEMFAPDFGDAYGALQRVKPRAELHWVPVTAETRRRIYAVSPAFATLRPHLDSPSRPWSCPATGRPECANVAEGEIPGAWFQWALRDAVAAQRHYATPATAAAFYRRVAAEVNRACESGELECLPPRSGLAPRLPADFIPILAGELTDALGFVLRLDVARPSVQLRLYSDGDSPRAESRKVFHDAILPFAPVSTTNTIIGWAYAQGSPITLTIRDRAGVFWPTTVTWLDSPEVVRRAQSIGRSPAFAARARFVVVTECLSRCQFFVHAPEGVLAIADVPGAGEGFGNAAVDGWVDQITMQESQAAQRWSGVVSEVDRARLRAMDAILDLYRAVLPAVMAAGAVAFVLAGWDALRRRGAPDAWWIALACVAALASRLGLLAGIEATSYYAINTLYMAPAIPMALGWCGFSLAAALSRIGWPTPSTGQAIEQS